MPQSTFILHDSIELAMARVFAANGDILANDRVQNLDTWRASIEIEEAYPPAVVTDSETFTNDGGAAGWPLYVGSVYVHAVTNKADDPEASACKTLGQAVFAVLNGARFAAEMNAELTGTGITYHGATCEPGTNGELDADNWNEVGWTLTVRCQQ
jgi:hypothetical protein